MIKKKKEEVVEVNEESKAKLRVVKNKKSTESSEGKVSTHSYLRGLFLVDTSPKDGGYVSMLAELSKFGDSVEPVLVGNMKNKLSDFIDSTINRVGMSDFGEETPQIEESKPNGPSKIEVTFL